jgi:predicted MFS family arabinose efflux permease
MNDSVAATHLAPADGWFAITSCLALGTAGYAVYLGLPVILGTLADSLGLDARQIGWLASVELGGMLIASLLASRLVRSGRYRQIAIGGMALAVVANLASLATTGFGALVGVRLLAGIGSGLCYSTAIAALCLTKQPARNFSLFGTALIVLGSLELYVLPSIAGRWAASGVFGMLAGAYLVPALMLKALPASVPARDIEELSGVSISAATSGITRLALLCLAAIVCFNVASAAFWAYSERIGIAVGMSPKSAANMLTILNLLSLGGCAIALWAARRWGQYRTQLAALGVIAVVFAVWSQRLDTTTYVPGTAIFFEAWAMSAVLQMSTLSMFDVTGRFAALVPAAQGIGQSAGPFIAGFVLGLHENYAQLLALNGAFVVATMLFYAWVYLNLRRDFPSIATA